MVFRKTSKKSYSYNVMMAVGVGFEPTEPLGSLVFKTRAFGHSATPPSPGIRRMAAYTHDCNAVAGAREGEHSAEAGRHEDCPHPDGQAPPEGSAPHRTGQGHFTLWLRSRVVS